MLALVFARLARQFPAAGGPYAYTRAAFGDVAGFLVAWGYWLSMVGTLAALAVACVGYLDPFMPSLVRTPVGRGRAGGRHDVAGHRRQHRRRRRWRAASRSSRPRSSFCRSSSSASAACSSSQPRAFAMPARRDHDAVGPPADGGRHADAVGVSRARVRDDSGRERARSRRARFPRATIVGTVLTAIVYIVSTIGVMSLVPPDTLASSTAPFADGARRLLGEMGGASGGAGRGDVVLRGAQRLGARRGPAARWRRPPTGCFPGCSRGSPRAARRRSAMIVAGVLLGAGRR